ncbi:hypothetical protein FOBRF1_007078 [Fusarium oxysporum]
MKLPSLVALALSGLIAAQSKTSLTDALGSQNKTLSELNSLLETQPRLAQSLDRFRNVTFLAPSNDAIKALLKDVAVSNQLAKDPGVISGILQYHVLNGTYYASNFTDSALFIPTHLTNKTYTNVTTGQRVEGVAKGGTVSFYSGFKDQCNVTKADLNFTGGVIHIIDRVLNIPKNLTDTTITANLSATAGAFTQAKVLANLSDARNITVFAPSNSAFAKISSIVANFSESELAKVMEYHVIDGTVGYSSLLKNGTLKTAAGEKVNIKVDNGTVWVNAAKVIVPDVLIANGVVHVIDGVLNPENSTATANPTAKTQAPAFSGASSMSNIPFTSGVPTATEQATGLSPSTSTQGAAHATAAIAFGALLGGAAIAMNF